MMHQEGQEGPSEAEAEGYTSEEARGILGALAARARMQLPPTFELTRMVFLAGREKVAPDLANYHIEMFGELAGVPGGGRSYQLTHPATIAELGDWPYREAWLRLWLVCIFKGEVFAEGLAIPGEPEAIAVRGLEGLDPDQWSRVASDLLTGLHRFFKLTHRGRSPGLTMPDFPQRLIDAVTAWRNDHPGDPFPPQDAIRHQVGLEETAFRRHFQELIGKIHWRQWLKRHFP